MTHYIRYNRNGGTSTHAITAHNRKRDGKTAKDHKSGAWKQRLVNRANRSAA